VGRQSKARAAALQFWKNARAVGSWFTSISAKDRLKTALRSAQGESRVNAIEPKTRPFSIFRRIPPQLMLLVTFASFYFAIGPGNFFAVDEAMQQETAQALILRHTIDIPLMVDARFGRGRSWYTLKGPGLPLVSLPFVYLGLKLDDAAGSMNGGQLAGPPIGPPEQPLRWGGRLAISASLIVNALAGGAIVAVLFMVGMQLSSNPRAALFMAVSAGLATLVMSEATHFYQHELDALMAITAFWFFSGQNIDELDSRGLLGGLCLGVAILSRPDALTAVVILWLYGTAVAWKLVRTLGDRWSRMIRRTILAAAGPLCGAVGSMYFNYLRFGSILQFGYIEDRARFVLDLAQISRAVGAYLLSPGLSIFLFAPPLILSLAVGRQAYRRWPLETTTLIVASVAHLLLISSMKTWSGDLSFGPRFMLESIVLLMPLTLPAFEMAVDRVSRRATIAVAAVLLLGFAVQLIGIAVNVGIIERKRIAAGVVAHNAWAFVLSVSPLVVDLQEIVAHRASSPWALRAFAIPDVAFLLLIVLLTIVLFGSWRIYQYLRTPEAEPGDLGTRALPMAIVLAALVPILVGFAIARPLTNPPGDHAHELFNAGVAAQKAGRAVLAEEDYGMVLSLYPSNDAARFNLGVLQQDAGRTIEAMLLYQGVLQKDPNYAPAQRNMEYIMRTHFGFGNQHPR
jgi:energy-converting hydrogenase Eha subunit B